MANFPTSEAGGDVSLPQLQLANEPVLLVVGSEGKGLSRLVTETCDALYEIARRRA